ncbi:MAG: sensor histidine kinase [Anaerolineae bacterium]|nr:sensor histidine kinase [Anaerolineae bacterium]
MKLDATSEDATLFAQIVDKIRTGRMPYGAFVVSVVTAYVSTLGFFIGQPDIWRWWVSSGLGIVFLLMGTVGFAYCEVRCSALISILYFVFQIPLAWLIGWLSQWAGLSWLLSLFLIGHAVALLPQPGVVLIGVLTVLESLVATGVQGNLRAALSVGASTLAGVVFVAVFTNVAQREELARKEVERLAAQLAAANDRLRAHAVQAEELAMTRERNRMAREIHDGLGHYLTAINMQLKAAQAVLSLDPQQAAGALEKAQHLSGEALADVRRSVGALRASPTKGRSLPEAIAALIGDCEAEGVFVEFAIRGEVRDLTPQVELTLFRAAQEGLTNARKHAAATRITLTLDFAARDRVRLVALDNGRGAVETGGGFGLVGLRERVQLLGGTTRIQTAPGQGFQLEVEVLA